MMRMPFYGKKISQSQSNGEKMFVEISRLTFLVILRFTFSLVDNCCSWGQNVPSLGPGVTDSIACQSQQGRVLAL